MIKKKLYLKFIGLILIFGSIAFMVIGPLLPKLVDLETYRYNLIELLEKSLQRQVCLGEMSFRWQFGPSFVFKDVHIKERNSPAAFISADKITLKVGMLPLLKKQISLNEVVVDGLIANITRDDAGELNIDDLLKPSKDGVDLHLDAIRIKKGTVVWQDLADGVKVNTRLSDLDLYLDNLTRGNKSSFKIASTITELHGKSGTIKASGHYRLPDKGDGLNKLYIDAKLQLKGVSYSPYWSYFSDKLPFAAPGGTLDLDANIKGVPEQFTSKGTIRLNNGKVVWPAVFHYPVSPKTAQVTFDLKRTPSSLEIPNLNLALDGFAIKGSFYIKELNTKDPLLIARGVTERFEYKNIRSYVPFGIIEPDTADFIENKIKAGLFKLDNGTLEGHFSKLKRFTEGNNAEALYIKGTVENAVVSYGGAAPSFNTVKGTLELKERNFHLTGMSGFYGKSPFTMHGSITDYSTPEPPSTYPFQMEITPQPSEIAWLAKLVGAERLNFSGPSTLHLTGEGPISAFRLSGNWLLAQASYNFPDIINKPAGMPNSLAFSSILSKNDVNLTSVSYTLHPLAISATAKFRHSGGPPHINFQLQTNSFMMRDQLPVFTGWKKFHPRGQVQAHLFGAGDPRDFSAMDYQGSVQLAGFSVRPSEKLPPVNAINGNILFKGNSLQTSSVSVNYGKTALNLKGKIASLKNPEAELFITTPELFMTDFGIKIKDAPSIKRFSANIGFRKGLYTIRNISGRLDRSVFSAAGTIKPEPEMDINLRLAASYLDIEELLPLLAPEKQLQNNGNGSRQEQQTAPFKIHGQITAEAGKYRDTTFNKLSLQFRNDGGLLKLQELEAGLWGGKFKAKGQLERIAGQPSKWTLSFLLDRIKSDDLLHSIGINRETSGLMTVKGDLRAQGSSLEELKRSATGNLSLRIDRGVLRRFNSLARVFSLLNISQLLKFQLPDMNHDGMPFNHITTTVGVKDGVISSQDFFIDSNAMHISMVGKIDIVKEELDLLIGVQPLQTVDKVISRIPVVGWILTGGDGSLITTYFEAKGTWADPKVTAIPVQSIASGTLNIFRRVFELPVRVFTDSGEVILGNQKERPKAKEEE